MRLGTAPALARVRYAIGFLCLFVACLAPSRVAAQITQLAVAGFPLSVTNTTGADFDAGAVTLGNTTVTVNSTLNLFAFSPRITTVQVRCPAACPRSGTLPMAGLQWKRADQATWTSITTVFTDIETRTVVHNGTNDPWTQTVNWRYQVSWTGNPPAAATAFYIEFRMVVTAP